ncbi:MAG: PAS domain S-box protein, partial [Chloroflexi bacterium]|nr:PAS domain S-box protein [Chloroflexota bacterium]
MIQSSISARQEGPGLHTVLGVGHGKFVSLVDIVFGLYCLVLVAAALLAWSRGQASWTGAAAFFFYLLTNIVLSELSRRSTRPQRVELVRVAAGALVAPLAYVLAGGPLSNWWPGFLIMCLGGNVLWGLLTGSPRIGRRLVAYYLALFFLAELLFKPVHDWYAFVVEAGVVAMVGLIFAEVVSQLGKALAAEREQRRQLALEKSHSESLLQKEAEETLRQSEARFRSLVEISPDGVVIVDQQGFLCYVSPAYERLAGQPAAELLGQHFQVLIHPDDLPWVFEKFATVIQNPGQAVAAEYRHLRKGSLVRIASATATLLPGGEVVAYVRDVTEQKQTELERRRAEEALRRLNAELEDRVAERTARLEQALAESKRLVAIIEATSDYVGIIDLAGHGVYLNQAGRRLIGVDESLVPGQVHVSEVFPARVVETDLQQSLAAALNGEIWSAETFLRHRDGHEIPVSQVAFPLYDTEGKIEYLATIIRDISERKQIEEALRNSVETFRALSEAAEAANRAKSTFLANMSHEIRTPMNAVIGMTGLLLNTSLSPKQRDLVETIRNSGDALLTIINDILDFSKIEAGKLELEKQPFDIRACVESALDLLAPRAAEKGLDLAYVVADGTPNAIVGDVTRLRQILVNLVSNAIKFTERGEVVVSVAGGRWQGTGNRGQGTGDEVSSVRALQGKAHQVSSENGAGGGEQIIHFAVRDTGIGVPADKLERLFHSFTQLDPSTTRQYGGTGLGLAISKRLAELMGGAMWAESSGAPG